MNPSRFHVFVVLVLGGCYEPPQLTGTDQVWDWNSESAATKDTPLAATPRPEVDDVMAGLVTDPDGPGCAVGVIENGQVTYLHGYGKAVVGGADWDVDTVGLVGSVSKTITATAVMRMADQGWLSIDDTVGDHLQTGNTALDQVTISRLLDHTAGVGGDTKQIAGNVNFEPSSPVEVCPVDPTAFAECAALSPALASPRTAFGWYEGNTTVDTNLGWGDTLPVGVYSNEGYSVLGAIVDELSVSHGYTGYEGWIWNTLGLWTGSELSSEIMPSMALIHSWRLDDIPNVAQGYHGQGVGATEVYPWSLQQIEGWEGPVGGWSMTIGDLARFNAALNTGALFPEPGSYALALMRLPFSEIYEDADDPGTHQFDYGLGMIPDSSEGSYRHGGVITGHTALWSWWPDEEGDSYGVVLMCNSEDYDINQLYAVSESIVEELSSPFGTAPGGFPSPAPYDPEELDQTTFALDTSGSMLSSHPGLNLPLVLTHTPLLSVKAARDRSLSLSLGEGSVKNDTYTLARDRPVQDLGRAVLDDNPVLASVGANVGLDTPVGVIEVRDLRIKVVVQDPPKSLAQGSLSGTLDARDLEGVTGDRYTAVCAELARAGAPCTPCVDEVRACLDVSWTGIVGTRVTAAR